VKSRTLVVTVVKDSHSLVDLVDIAVDTVLLLKAVKDDILRRLITPSATDDVLL